MKRWLLVLVLLAQVWLVPFCFAQKRWTGNAGTAYWNDPLNWEDELLPSEADHVLLDNSFFKASYEVILPDVEVQVQSLEISPAGNSLIQLLLPVSNTVSSAAGVTGAKAFITKAGGYSLLLRRNAVFVNASGSASGYSVYFNDSIRIENGAKYIHRTRTGHADIFNRLSRMTGTELGVIRMENTDASSTISISDRVFGSLELSGEMSPTGSSTYSASGSNSVMIRGDLVLEGCTLSLHFSDTIHVSGDLRLHSSTLNLSTGNRSSCIRLRGNWIQNESTILESNSSAETGTILLSGNTQQQIDIDGEIRDSVRLVVDNSTGVRVSGILRLPYELEFKSGLLHMETASLYMNEGSFVKLSEQVGAFDDAIAQGVEGAITKLFASGETMLFPLVRSGKNGYMKVRNFEGEFKVEYHRSDPNLPGQQFGAGLAELSTVEYWTVEANAPLQTGEAIFEFSFEQGRSGMISDVNQLTIAAYRDGQWQAIGHNTISNEANGGYIEAVELIGGELMATRYTIGNKAAGVNILPVLLERSWLTRSFNRWEVHWVVGIPELIEYFELEFSDNGRSYRKIDAVQAVDGKYSYSVLLPLKTEDGFCRLKLVQQGGRVLVGPVLKIESNTRQNDFHAVLIPANNGIKLFSGKGGEYELEIYSQSGQMLSRCRYKQKAGTAFYALPARFSSSGSVVVRITDGNGISKTIQQGW